MISTEENDLFNVLVITTDWGGITDAQPGVLDASTGVATLINTQSVKMTPVKPVKSQKFSIGTGTIVSIAQPYMSEYHKGINEADFDLIRARIQVAKNEAMEKALNPKSKPEKEAKD